MIVVDASSLVKYVLHEENWKDVSYFVKERKPLYSVDHVVEEVGNAVWKHCCLRRVISREKALKLYQSFVKLFQTGVIVAESEEAYLDAALQIALDYGVTFYDSLYLAQAQKYGEFLTSDEKQADIANQLGIKVYLI